MMIKILKIFSCIILFISCTKHDGYYDYVNTDKVYNGNTFDYLSTKNNLFDSLKIVLSRLPHLEKALANEEVTLFAPSNLSFTNALNNLNLVRSNQFKSPLNLRNIDLVELDSMMCKYIVPGKVTTDQMEFTDGLALKTYAYDYVMNGQRRKENATGLVSGGIEILYYSDTKDNLFEAQWVRAESQAINILTRNGVIHVLSGRHEFGFGNFLSRMNK